MSNRKSWSASRRTTLGVLSTLRPISTPRGDSIQRSNRNPKLSGDGFLPGVNYRAPLREMLKQVHACLVKSKTDFEALQARKKTGHLSISPEPSPNISKIAYLKPFPRN